MESLRRTGRSALGLQGVVDGLRLDHAVTEDERIDAIVGTGLGGIGSPFQQEHVAGVGLSLYVPGRVWQVGEQLPKGLPDSVLAASGTRGADHHGVIGVICDDLIKVRGSQRLAVMSEYLLRRARHHNPPSRAGRRPLRARR